MTSSHVGAAVVTPRLSADAEAWRCTAARASIEASTVTVVVGDCYPRWSDGVRVAAPGCRSSLAPQRSACASS
eukprot:scaffold1561_cov42-Phaeocystis_antarctica.AAC.1